MNRLIQILLLVAASGYAGYRIGVLLDGRELRPLGIEQLEATAAGKPHGVDLACALNEIYGWYPECPADH